MKLDRIFFQTRLNGRYVCIFQTKWKIKMKIRRGKISKKIHTYKEKKEQEQLEKIISRGN